MHRSLRILALCAALIASTVAPAAASDVPLPDTIEYVEPAADLPEGLRRFIGRWEGKWGTELNHIFIVTNVRADGSADAIYAYGDAEKWKVRRDWHRVKGTISGNRLELPRFPNSAEVNYALQSDGSLKGEYWFRRYMTPGTFKPVR